MTSLGLRDSKICATAANLVFVSYHHGDHDMVAQRCRDVCQSLSVPVWMDKDSLDTSDLNAKGQIKDLDEQIAQAIRQSSALIIVFSEIALSSSRYGQREIRMAAALRREHGTFPLIAIVRTDKSPVPATLQQEADSILTCQDDSPDFEAELSCVLAPLRDTTPSSETSITTDFVELGLDPNASRRIEARADEFLNWAKDEGWAILQDPELTESGVLTEAETAFFQFIRAEAKSFAARVIDAEFGSVISSYQGFEASEFWQLDHPIYEGRPAYQFDAMSIISDTMFAWFSVESDHFGLSLRLREGLLHLDNLTRCAPYSMSGGGQESLHVQRATRANLLLIDALRYPQRWIDAKFGSMPYLVPQMSGLSEPRVTKILDTAKQKAALAADYLAGFEQADGA